MKAKKVYESMRHILKPKTKEEISSSLASTYNMDPEIFNFLNDLDFKFQEFHDWTPIHTLVFYKPIKGITIHVALTDTLDEVKKRVYRQL